MVNGTWANGYCKRVITGMGDKKKMGMVISDE